MVNGKHKYNAGRSNALILQMLQLLMHAYRFGLQKLGVIQAACHIEMLQRELGAGGYYKMQICAPVLPP